MEIIGLGIDIIEISRIGAVYRRKGERFLSKVFAPSERAAIMATASEKARLEKMAGRFATKEAVMKALGTGWRQGVAWREIVVDHLPTGEPTVSLVGRTAEVARARGIEKIRISMSHSNEMAVAQAIALARV